jgi:hypothetical protein
MPERNEKCVAALLTLPSHLRVGGVSVVALKSRHRRRLILYLRAEEGEAAFQHITQFVQKAAQPSMVSPD